MSMSHPTLRSMFREASQWPLATSLCLCLLGCQTDVDGRAADTEVLTDDAFSEFGDDAFEPTPQDAEDDDAGSVDATDTSDGAPLSDADVSRPNDTDSEDSSADIGKDATPDDSSDGPADADLTDDTSAPEENTCKTVGRGDVVVENIHTAMWFEVLDAETLIISGMSGLVLMDLSGTRPPLALGNTLTGRFVVAGDYVFSSAEGFAAVHRTLLDGSSPPVSIYNGGNNFGFATDGADVFWTNELGSTLFRTPADPVEIVPLSTERYPKAIVVDDAHIYFESLARIMRLPKDGSEAPVDLLGSGLYPLLPPGFFGYSVSALALDDDAVYFVSSTQPGLVGRLDLSTLSPSLLAASVDLNPTEVAVDDQYVYFAHFGERGRILRTPKSGAGELETLACDILAPGRIIIAHGFVWFLEMNRFDIIDENGFRSIGDPAESRIRRVALPL